MSWVLAFYDVIKGTLRSEQVFFLFFFKGGGLVN